MLTCSQMVTGDKSNPGGAEIAGATSISGDPGDPPPAAVRMWTTDEVNINRTV